ncbi:MAG: hypothetical protein KY468_03155, partial [Armatimonadetes bacterium]|nr:hypothetical protein [Armatimonadota bacterium]
MPLKSVYLSSALLLAGITFPLTSPLAAVPGDSSENGSSRASPANPWPVSPDGRNPWTPEMERGYRERARHALEQWKDRKPRGGTYGENEKNYYPTALFAYLTGDRPAALKALQEEDNAARTDHAHTAGIDFFWAFTLKGQVRKYFLLGDALDPAYRKRMFEGAKAWTKTDPTTTPHPLYGTGKPSKSENWSPEIKGYRVDRRNTDNLRAMRDTSVYLFAEETGNEATRKLYEQKIREYVQTLYHIGMSEWDSPNYHGHAIATYHNLYDFAKDPEVKALAKAALDWLYAAGAFKYYRGGFNGPNARDYGGHLPFGSNAS